MKFRLQYIVKDFGFDKKQKLDFVFNEDAQPVQIEMRRLDDDELGKNYKKGDIICTASADAKIDPALISLFGNMTDTILEPLRDVIENTRELLYKWQIGLIQNFMWVRGNLELYKPIRYYHSYQWSADGETWKGVPGQIAFGNVMIGIPVEKVWSEAAVTAVVDLTKKQITPSLAYELLSEAWSQRMENPRSALVIAVASAETGFKEFVSKLLPDTDWLLTNIQSPPLVVMLKKFLPIIDTKLKIGGRVLPPPKETLQILSTGIELRNKIIHARAETVSSKTVDELIKAIRDILYLLDYYSGHDWAQKNISVSAIQSILATVKKSNS